MAADADALRLVAGAKFWGKHHQLVGRASVAARGATRAAVVLSLEEQRELVAADVAGLAIAPRHRIRHNNLAERRAPIPPPTRGADRGVNFFKRGERRNSRVQCDA